MDEGCFAEVTFAFGILGRSQVTQTWFTAEQLARSGYFEPLGHSFFGLSTSNGSWHGARDCREPSQMRNCVFGRGRGFVSSF